MNIQLSQIYAETDVSFDVTNNTLRTLRYELESLGKIIAHYQIVIQT